MVGRDVDLWRPAPGQGDQVEVPDFGHPVFVELAPVEDMDPLLVALRLVDLHPGVLLALAPVLIPSNLCVLVPRREEVLDGLPLARVVDCSFSNLGMRGAALLDLRVVLPVRVDFAFDPDLGRGGVLRLDLFEFVD